MASLLLASPPAASRHFYSEQSKRAATATLTEALAAKRAGHDVNAQLDAALAAKRALYSSEPAERKRKRQARNSAGFSYVVRDCPECGRILDRDINAARNLLLRALVRLFAPIAAIVAAAAAEEEEGPEEDSDAEADELLSLLSDEESDGDE